MENDRSKTPDHHAQPEKKPTVRPEPDATHEKDPAAEWGQREETGKAIERGGKTKKEAGGNFK